MSDYTADIKDRSFTPVHVLLAVKVHVTWWGSGAVEGIWMSTRMAWQGSIVVLQHARISYTLVEVSYGAVHAVSTLTLYHRTAS